MRNHYHLLLSSSESESALTPRTYETSHAAEIEARRLLPGGLTRLVEPDGTILLTYKASGSLCSKYVRLLPCGTLKCLDDVLTKAFAA